MLHQSWLWGFLFSDRTGGASVKHVEGKPLRNSENTPFFIGGFSEHLCSFTLTFISAVDGRHRNKKDPTDVNCTKRGSFNLNNKHTIKILWGYEGSFWCHDALQDEHLSRSPLPHHQLWPFLCEFMSPLNIWVTLMRFGLSNRKLVFNSEAKWGNSKVFFCY